MNIYILSAEKRFETLPKHNVAAFISESFALNLYTLTPLTNIQLVSPF